MRKKNLLTTIIITALLSLTLTACGSKTTDTALTDTQSVETSDTTASGSSGSLIAEVTQGSKSDDESEEASSGKVTLTKASDVNNSDDSSDNTESSDSSSDESESSSDSSESSSNSSESSSDSKDSSSDDSLFSKRDLKQTADTDDATVITAESNKTISITDDGVYIVKGTANNFTIRVEADKENAKVQLVLDGVNITNDSAPVIYVVSADKCFVTTTDSENYLTVSGSFSADGSTNTDAVIFSKDDLVLNGVGTLTISSTDNGISCKDDLKITGGSYVINSEADAIEANDSILIADGNFTINSGKDGLHCENDDDLTVGYIYIENGSFDITAKSDGIQGTTFVQIDGGSFTITASEGIEATNVQINGGDINISATDDGINASMKSNSDPYVEINGGNVTIKMGSGDVDAIDANGSVYVNGGTIDITVPTQGTAESFDYDNSAEFNGGTIIINGSEVSEIPTPMMMGGGGRGGMGPGGDMGDFTPGDMGDFNPGDMGGRGNRNSQ